MDNPHLPLDNPVSDNRVSEENQLTTHDVRDEAQEALQRYLLDTKDTADTDETLPSPLTLDKPIVIIIKVEGWDEPMQVPYTGELIIGRQDPLLAFTPAIDLTSYGGYQMGISRKHAAIRMKEGILYLIDLGSRNGTYLEGQRLEPEQPRILHGRHDHIRLGKVVLFLTVKLLN